MYMTHTSSWQSFLIDQFRRAPERTLFIVEHGACAPSTRVTGRCEYQYCGEMHDARSSKHRSILTEHATSDYRPLPEARIDRSRARAQQIITYRTKQSEHGRNSHARAQSTSCADR